MKRILVVFTVIAVLGLSSFDVGTFPYGNPAPLSLFLSVEKIPSF